jgi:pimeloyl-ACP methyl ester carboxylesterase
MADLRDRVARGEKLLGLLVPDQGLPPGAGKGLDLLVVRPTTPASVFVTSGLPVALLIESSGDLIEDAVTVARDTAVGADIVLSDDGAARLVTSPAAARTAFATGARVVVYDGDAMVAATFTDLAAVDPEHDASLGREPLVLLSGMLGDEQLWDDVAAGITDIAVPWPARIDLDDSVPEMALSVLAAAPPRFALAGHSLGAIVALEVMRRAPERVTRLALLNASGRGPSEDQLTAWARAGARTEGGEFDQVAAELATATVGAAHRDDDLIARNARMAATVGPDGFLRQLAAQATRPESRPSLSTIGVPVLVVSGEDDTICPPALQRELVELCRAAELATIPGCGHMAPLEDPAAVTELLRRWLRVPAQPGMPQ